MAKVLFVLCVPVEDSAKLATLSDDKDSEDIILRTANLKDADDEVDADLKEQKENIKDAKGLNLLTEVSEAGTNNVETTDSGSDISEANLRNRNHIDKDTVLNLKQESSRGNNLVDGSKNKVENAENSVLGSDNFNKKTDEDSDKNTNNNKEKNASEDNSEVYDKVRKNSVKNGDETDGKRSSSKKKKKSIDFSEDHEIEYISFVSDGLTLLERVKATLEVLDIPAVNWSLTQDNICVGMFIAGSGEQCEEILNKLTYLDIGNVPGSSISVFPASISVASVAKEEQDEKMKQEMEKVKLAERVSEFKKSIKSRLVVAQVVDSVKSDAVFTFDYLMLLILAGMVAVMGLLEASSVSLVASMLISPLMGPIIAFVFGAVIRNTDLMIIGISSEIKGLALCLIVGFLSGLISAGLESSGLQWRSTENWPTTEMAARGALRSLPVGVLIALPSGAGVALSILGGKVGSLVGVAISASLLPPAVNAGLLWANAIIVAIAPPLTGIYDRIAPQNVSEMSAAMYEPGLNCPPLLHNDYIPIYSCNMAVESAVLGVISLLLTLINILCIIIMGVVVLKIKEVAPMRAVPDAEKDFFAKDLKVARESYETTKGPNSTILGKRILQEYQKFKQEIGVDDSKNTDSELNEILEDVEEGEDVKEILDKLPHRPKRWSSYVEIKEDMAANPYHTFHGATFRPSSPDISIGIRKRGSAVVTFSPPRIDDDRHSSSYFTAHHFHETPEALHSPRISHRSPGRYFSKKSKGRFHVAKVEEDNHIDLPKAPCVSTSPSKVEIMPAIKEQECVPLLNVSPKEA